MSTVAWSPGALGPLLDDGPGLSWQDAARCAEVDPEIFYPERGESARPAKQVCQGCEVRAACLAFAVDNGIAFGIWGGLSERQRRRLGTQHLDSAPGPRLCANRLHPLAGVNLTADGRCRECRNASRRVAEDRKGLAA
jgi:WhiB family redox-sensing transcriptional regulator